MSNGTTAALAYEVMTEKELDRHVRRLCTDLGLLRYHPMDSRGSSSGYPDLTVAGPNGVIFAELKSAVGKLRPDQVTWRDQLLTAGARWHLWRPADLAAGTIAAELAAISIYAKATSRR
jgi:hypothetical protein